MNFLRVRPRSPSNPHQVRRGLSILTVGFLLTGGPAWTETLTVLPAIAGTTPTRLGYNLAHFMPGSNAADWFRYAGADAARVFISVSDIEPVDDLAPAGDGVASEAGFLARRNLLRANAASPIEPLDPAYVNWAAFIHHYSGTASGNNRQQLSYALGNLRDRGISILANITASPSRFPVSGTDDWAGQWELWQHYYAQAFLLGRDFGVQHFSMFNEPNGWAGMTEALWLQRWLICSDALQSALTDVNQRYGRSLIPQIFAPTTANGAEKYDTAGADEASTDTWGRDAVANRHRRLDGSDSPTWSNLHVYSYQKYTTRTHPSGGFSGYVTDYDLLRGNLNADMPGEPPLPLALTEFNVRTGANYDATANTQDSPLDYAALGANCIALTERGIHQLYLFKFGQTASASTYGVAKNGTHYVQNGAAHGNNYGGATQCAEVFRLFCKAAAGARPRYQFTASAGASWTSTGGLWSMVTHDAAAGTWHVFLANKQTSAIPLEVNFSALAVPPDNPVFVEEVSETSRGGIVRLTHLHEGRLAMALVPAQSVQLITLPSRPLVVTSRAAAADAVLGDGSSKSVPGGSAAVLTVRADGTADGRRVVLIRIPVPPGHPAETHSILLDVGAAVSNAGSGPVQSHVYGLADNSWAEDTVTWQNSAAFLKQNIPGGTAIQHNIINPSGGLARMLGQLVVASTQAARRFLDVTEFVKSRPDGTASFLIVQEHRWDMAQPSLTPGDLQPAGLVITSREQGDSGPRLIGLTREPPWNAWRELRFAGEAGEESVAGAAADPDRDGIPNLLEYALGGGPLDPDPSCLPGMQQMDGRLEFRFEINPAHQDLRITVQVAHDPGGIWTDAAVSVRGQPFSAQWAGISVTASDAPSGPLRELVITEEPPTGSLRRFMRLRVELLDQ